MTAGGRKLQLLITIVLGNAEEDVTLERVSVPVEVNPVPSIPAFAATVAASRECSSGNAFEEFRARKRLAQCLLMDQFDIENGDKAIGIALHRHWTSDLSIIFGPPDSPSTIKRWRSQRGTSKHRRLAEMRARDPSRNIASA
jgi:hypothetical protein